MDPWEVLPNFGIEDGWSSTLCVKCENSLQQITHSPWMITQVRNCATSLVPKTPPRADFLIDFDSTVISHPMALIRTEFFDELDPINC